MKQTKLNTNEQWLKTYYYARAAVSGAWMLAAFSVAQHSAAIAAALLVFYPLWDALANLVDGMRSGGVMRNRTQLLNTVASLLVAVAIWIALPDMHQVLAVFGVWAILSGLLQLGTALRRWKLHGAQWAMVLSGGQSALAGSFFIIQAQAAAMPTIATVAGYAGFGAFYFLVSALSLSISGWRRKSA
ncbi:DUF308 domain-containing protein [Duganella sp. sic0402]|uniref:DUF308 domain-containing protein n=1 Tax=Duganella sp. sic0402 TaxID=2854786 RepID=UPI001C48128D|nr:DUF308 domain-containing protein [Duganella sp. sic0402]MBV7534984.1 DUF308 domain-containing protein [Duganella sp. sic0402]